MAGRVEVLALEREGGVAQIAFRELDQPLRIESITPVTGLEMQVGT